MEKNETSNRVEALDALRGFDMMFIMGLTALAIGIDRAVGGSCVTKCLVAQLEHVDWAGLHVEDIIFPLFIFIAGVAFPFSYHKSLETGRPIIRKAVTRCLLLILLGALYNGLLMVGPMKCRYASVLARIGTSWFGAVMLYLFVRRRRTRWLVAAGLLVGYWIFMLYIPVPGAGGHTSFTPDCNWGVVFDKLLLPGYEATGWKMDPEGIVSILPSITLGIFGVEAGDALYRCRAGEFSVRQLLLGYLAVGASLILIGLVWSLDFPIVKKIWSSSFLCVSGGISFLLLALFYLLADVWKLRKTLFVFKVIGMNALTIYLAQSIIDFTIPRRFFFKWIQEQLPTAGQAIFYPFAYMLICWLFLYFLYRKKIFLKI